MMLARSYEHCQKKGAVGVVARFVHPRQMRRPAVGSAQVFAVAFSTVRRIELGSFGDQLGVLRLDAGVTVGTSTTAGGEDKPERNEE